MKSNRQKKFHTRVLVNIIYSLVITMLFEVFFVNVIVSMSLYSNMKQSQNELVFSAVHFETVVVLFFVLFGIVLFTAIFYLLQRRSFLYIQKLSNAMRAIAEGNLNTYVQVEDDNEFSDMASNLNYMIKELNALMERERESERTKNELITNIAHDLRTPLTSIIGYLELISKSKNLTEETRINYTEVAYTKAKKLQKLIEDLFGFTKLNYGKIALNLSKVDLVKLLTQLMDEFYPSFANNNLAYSLKSNLNSVIITADPNLLARLFENLIGNAIKYGADGKEINVKIAASASKVKVSVINYGKVIPEDEIGLIFEKFYRLEQSRSSKTGGTGLGLAIAKNIVELHGGTIEVKSDLEGTHFIVSLRVNLDMNKENFGYV